MRGICENELASYRLGIDSQRLTWLAFVIGFTIMACVSTGGDNVLLRNLVVH